MGLFFLGGGGFFGEKKVGFYFFFFLLFFHHLMGKFYFSPISQNFFKGFQLQFFAFLNCFRFKISKWGNGLGFIWTPKLKPFFCWWGPQFLFFFFFRLFVPFMGNKGGFRGKLLKTRGGRGRGGVLFPYFFKAGGGILFGGPGLGGIFQKEDRGKTV